MSMAESARKTAGQSFLVVVFALLGLPCGGCGYARMLYLNTPSLAAPTYFDSRIVHASSTPLALPVGSPEATLGLTASEHARYRSSSTSSWRRSTRAHFSVIHDDVIVYERYFHGVSAASELPAFSMSKTFAAVLIGRAVSQGLLASVEGSVTRYIPELVHKPRYGEITLERLLRMTSGIDFHESRSMAPSSTTRPISARAPLLLRRREETRRALPVRKHQHPAAMGRASSMPGGRHGVPLLRATGLGASRRGEAGVLVARQSIERRREVLRRVQRDAS